MKRYFPYSLPIFITLVFILICYSGQYWFGLILFPLITFFTVAFGKFSLEEVIDEYIFFHHTYGMEIFRGISAFLFISFNLWVAFFLHQYELAWFNLFFFIYAVILINSNFAISLAHDLMHSAYVINRAFGTVLLLSNGFFYLEMDHIYIHHKFVGTEKDPASALRNEGVYAYLKRSVTQRFVIIFYGVEEYTEELRKTIRIKSTWRLCICISFLFLSYLISFQYFLCIFFQYLFVTLLYEVITYIQHYGLRRNTENVDLSHSWNCYYRLSSYMHYMMPVHSIHHLRTEPEVGTLEFAGPSFPEPFSRMVLFALQPGKWKQTMEKAINTQGL